MVDNNLQTARKALRISQRALSERCKALAKEKPNEFSSVSLSAVRDLERGAQRPQRRKAATLAAILETEIETLFPLGCDDPNHNPDGITRIPADRKKGGRPRQM